MSVTYGEVAPEQKNQQTSSGKQRLESPALSGSLGRYEAESRIVFPFAKGGVEQLKRE